MNQALVELARRNFLGFVKATMPGYSIGWVHRVIAAELQQFLADVIDKKSPRLILTMPPRHGKSQLVSRHFPSWFFGNYPDFEFISASYSAELATKMGRDVQQIMNSPEYAEIFPNVRLQDARLYGSEKTKIAFEIPGYKGNYKGAGVDGGITGRGAHILNIDDPFKNRKEADSPTMREGVWDWYSSTAYTRLAPGGGVLVTQTRWHEDDLAGRLIRKEKEEGGDHWRVVNFPAIAEDDELYRKAGEALHPDRFPLEALQRIRKTIGEYDWNALYQQRPTARSGGIFKRSWIRHWNTKPLYFDRLIQSWDFTFKDGAGSDNVAGTVWGQIGAEFYCMDMVCEKLDFVGQINAISRVTKKWPLATAKVVEDKANGPAIISALRSKIPGITPWTPHEGKEARAYAVSPLFEAGNVIFPPICKEYPWVAPFIEELTAFPNAPHDDRVDSTTQALLYLTGNRGRGIVDFI